MRAHRHTNTTLKSEQLVRLSPPDDAPLAREAVFEMDRRGQHAVSYVWITGAAKHFVKLRFTMDRAAHATKSLEARRAVLNALGAAIGRTLRRSIREGGQEAPDGRYSCHSR